MVEEGLSLIGDQMTEVLILGTFPSIQSRRICYYNNPQNQFWKIMENLLDMPELIAASPQVRYAKLKQYRIGLWDVIAKCEFDKTSSADDKIKADSIVYNDFTVLRKNFPLLKAIFFNSRNAQKFFKRYLKTFEDEALKLWLEDKTNHCENVLPSTSSAHARLCLDEKFQIWSQELGAYLVSSGKNREV